MCGGLGEYSRKSAFLCPLSWDRSSRGQEARQGFSHSTKALTGLVSHYRISWSVAARSAAWLLGNRQKSPSSERVTRRRVAGATQWTTPRGAGRFQNGRSLCRRVASSHLRRAADVAHVWQSVEQLEVS